MKRSQAETIQFTFPAYLNVTVTRYPGETTEDARARAIAVSENLAEDNVYGADGSSGYVMRRPNSPGRVTERRTEGD
jgi:hypothetical protein